MENSCLLTTSVVIMETSLSTLCRVPPMWAVGTKSQLRKPAVNFVIPGRRHRLNGNRRERKPAAMAVESELAAAMAEPAKVEITWQIIVGAMAGVTPFVVAGIEFSKRIIAQRRCGECRGSGLVIRDDDYFRCPSCGGFLPWQSWRRFFTG